jgi:hypothetical protein
VALGDKSRYDPNCDTEPQWRKRENEVSSSSHATLYPQRPTVHLAERVSSATAAEPIMQNIGTGWKAVSGVSSVGRIHSPAVTSHSRASGGGNDVMETKRRIQESQDMLNQLQASLRNQGV